MSKGHINIINISTFKGHGSVGSNSDNTSVSVSVILIIFLLF